MNEIKVSTENVHKAFHAAGDNPAIQELLINLFGKENVEPEQSKDVRERIKTFSDAYNELGEEHPYCIAFDSIYQNDSVIPSIGDVYSYLKLRIICAALNEGWEPKFTTDEYRWFPWFELFTQQELDDMSEERRSRVVARPYHYANVYGGVECASASDAASDAVTIYSSRLAFKSEELAEYCGKQFIDIWADFVFKVREQPTTMSDGSK